MSLTETLPETTGMMSDWTKGGTPSAEVIKEAKLGSLILDRLKAILAARFNEQAAKEYDVDASERSMAFAAGYRKCLKDIHRLIQLDT